MKRTIKNLISGLLFLCQSFIVADDLFTSSLNPKPIMYTVALENVGTWRERGWAIRTNEVFEAGVFQQQYGVNVSADPSKQLPIITYGLNDTKTGKPTVFAIDMSQGCALRRTQQNPTVVQPSINPTNSQIVIPNPSELLTGTTTYFSLCEYGYSSSNPYQNQIPNIDPIILTKKLNSTDRKGLENPLNACSLFVPVQISNLNLLATKLYGSINLKPYYPESYFHMTLILAAMNGRVASSAAYIPYSTYNLGEL